MQQHVRNSILGINDESNIMQGCNVIMFQNQNNYSILSYKPHPSQRGRVWSCCNHQVVFMVCNHLTQWSNNMLTSAKHVVMYLYSMTQMRAMKSTDLIGHIKFLLWRQHECCSATTPFLLAKVWLERLMNYGFHKQIFYIVSNARPPFS